MMISNIEVTMNVEIITTPTLIKLIVISNVASNSFGRSNNFKTSLYLISEPVLSSLKSLGVKEKNAISEPEIKAEINNNTIIAKILNTILKEKVLMIAITTVNAIIKTCE